MSGIKERNAMVDVVRGFAMFLVVLGHTITGCLINYEKSIVYEIIWSLQMPLFMLISGYVMRYSRDTTSAKELFMLVAKKTMAYIFPWAVWTIVIRGIVFGQHSYFNIQNLIYHMDQGYWFLISLFTISVIFSFSEFFAAKISKNQDSFLYIVFTTLLCIVGAIILLAVGALMGFGFLCIKLTLYYLPFFVLGFVFSKIQRIVSSKKIFNTAVDAIGVVSLLLWLMILNYTDFYFLKETVPDIAIRMFGSLVGCISVCCIFVRLPIIRFKILSYLGLHSLEIYLVHYLLLVPFETTSSDSISLLSGIGNVAVNFLFTILISMFVSWVLNKNSVARLILFGKKR